jgi:hypothetical protein
VGIGKAVWASGDRTSLTKASRQAGEHVTQRGHHTHRPGAWAGCNRQRLAGHSQEYPRSPHPREAKQPAQARQRRRLKAQERRARERRQAQHAAQRLEPALQALGLPPNLVSASEGRCRRQQKRLSQIVGMRCPPWRGGRTNPTRCRGRGGDKPLPSRLWGALPKRSWRQRLSRCGGDGRVPLWHQAASQSEATRRRWPWTWVGAEAGCNTYGEQLGLVGPWGRGQAHRGLAGLAGGLRGGVMGAGQVGVPVDCASRRPAAPGPGAPGRVTLPWVQGRLDGGVAACRRRGVARPPPRGVADRGGRAAKLRRHVATAHQGPVRVAGNTP